ncbi:hypothetical protein AAH678_16755 [Sodalis endosymbiont of Spalangia cameroni]|uniref:hypothetical protein n=1 Tax=Sodalis praecaptivus TaxID=1239307 RepID=UPI0031F7B1A2
MFKTFWTLKIIDIFFIIVWLLLSLVVVIALANNTPILIAIAVIALLFIRLGLECVAVQFVQAETLQKILSKLEDKDVNHE